jgi:hypothetical protein
MEWGLLRNWQLLGWLRNSQILVQPDGSLEPTNEPVGITHSYTLIMEAVFSKTTLDFHRAMQRTHHKIQLFLLLIRITFSHPTTLRLVVILSSHLILGLTSSVYISGLPTKILYNFFILILP